jgi:hypothetical protein
MDRLARLCLLCAVQVAAGTLAAATEVDFSRDIQPLLARRCFSCHGPDTQEAGLRLDDPKAATAELDSGSRAIVPENPDASDLLKRVTATDDTRMPPEGTPLSAAQVQTLTDWIRAGAKWQEHWAFRPLRRPPVPGKDQRVHPIDAFIRAGLAVKELPQPQLANKATLLRRATYDVTGLPPSEREMRDFLADESPDAWEKVVDRLLASPHYGEKWGRHWLDLVRYADTNSFERDADKPHAWRYRDYVIRSLNADKPYDRFVIEQLAGDELPDADPDSLIATGYYRLGMWDDEPADRLQSRYDWLDDIVATTGQTFLGLTVNCARCHDHKIDPIQQKDYYSLLAFFHAVTPMAKAGPTIERTLFRTDADREAFERRVADLEQRRDEAQQAVTAIEGRFREAWEKQTDAEAVAADLDDLQFRFYRDSWTTLPKFDELKPEDVGVVPGQRFDITVAPSLRPDNFGYVFSGFLKVPADGDYEFIVDSDDGSRLTVGDKVVVEHDGIHGDGDPRRGKVRLEAGRVPIRLDYFQGMHGKSLKVAWSGPGFKGRMLSNEPRAKGRQLRVADAIRAHGERLLGAEAKRDYDRKLAALEKLKREQVPVEMGLVVSENGPKAPDTFVFYRGNPHADKKPENRVDPAFPTVLRGPRPEISAPAGTETTGRRLALARWIASPDNPLTARVMANRVWQHHFGRGIVRSSSNFGLMGDPPTHPELLDWLAAELIAGNWRLKPLHRLILTSAAYRASSQANEAALAKDPLNDAFWRFDMRRLTAEELRDSIHVASGAFNAKMFGPGIYPTIPKEVMAGQSRPGSGWGSSPPEEQARRSIYIHVKRSLLTPILADFDLADVDTSCPVRFVTTQPTQALGMMNGEFLQRQAKVLAERVRRDVGDSQGDDTAAHVRRALEITLVRPATADEVSAGVGLVDRLEDQDGVGPTRAFEVYCLMVLNLNEFAYLD